MSDEQKPNPLDDLRKGFGLLFRAAKTAAEKLPTKEIEKAVVGGAREVGRAVETVGRAIEKEFRGHRTHDTTPEPQEPPKDEAKAPEPPKDENTPGGPRVD